MLTNLILYLTISTALEKITQLHKRYCNCITKFPQQSIGKTPFDTVNHDILFDKLEHYGIRGVALDWMKNYFHNRLQFVQYNDTLSTFKSIRCGVPQGSILGPLLFH